MALGHKLENWTALSALVYFPLHAHLIQWHPDETSRDGVMIPIEQMRGLSPKLLVKGHTGESVTGQESWVLVPSSCHHIALSQKSTRKTLIPKPGLSK